MDEYAGRVLAGRYRLPRRADDGEPLETRAFDTYSGQEVVVREVPLPEIVEAELADGPAGLPAPDTADPVVQRALDAARAAAAIPDHPRLDQVFDVFDEDGSIWVVSELVPARPLAALLSQRTLSPYRGAEVAADILTALRALHAHGWAHRNITPRTVLVCDDGRIVLTGLASGAAEDALCGYDPLPPPPGWGQPPRPAGSPGPPPGGVPTRPMGPDGRVPDLPDPATGFLPAPGAGGPRAHPGGYVPGGTSARFDAGGHPGGPAGAHGPLVSGGPSAGPGGPSAGPGGPSAGPGGPGARPAQSLAERLFAQASGRAEPDGPGRAALATAREGDEGGGAPRSAIATYRAGAQAAAARLAGGPVYSDRIETDGAGRTDPTASDPGGATGQTPLPTHRPAPEKDGRGSAAYGGSLPGPRPGASISVPLAGPPEPARAHPAPVQAAAPGRGGPRTRLDAERARQMRMQVVGPVTERWSPEQAGPVHEHWQLAPPVGPAADLWALGALLFRAVQGHPAYPEDHVAELVQLVCGEPPAMAEECGALRPVVESLLRQDPTERPDFEELRGWLRSLIRTAPEPDIGSRTVTVPPLTPGRADPRRLPILRRRGELVRRRRSRAAMEPLVSTQGARHKKARRTRRRGANSLGRWLIALIFMAMVAAIAIAAFVLPKAERGDNDGDQRRQSVSGARPEPQNDQAQGEGDEVENLTEPTASSAPPAEGTDPAELPKDFVMREDKDGFRVAMHRTWQRLGHASTGAVRYGSPDGRYEMLVAAGRDSTDRYGADLMQYQLKHEPELAGQRASTGWGESSALRNVTIGTRPCVIGTFTWQEDGREVIGRNFVTVIDGRFHVVLVKGPIQDRRSVDVFYQQAENTYSPVG
ncbi:serine/threonine protein kinase [Streptomyces sp. NPDC051940]|uniref:serine/threonine protein kinase n=1 Tax=Streptomyces sp. NPDC051940 TaxID=3155675 RepID=UPI003427298F